MTITVAVTGASGSIYAQHLVESLQKNDAVEKIYLVATDSALQVLKHELASWHWWKCGTKVEILDNHSMFSPIASGSAAADAMVIVPCSMGTLARVASGVSIDLVGRAADVMLKERRTLLICPRESPFSTIHLSNMTELSKAGAWIIPLSPSFYSKPASIDQLIDTMVDRILQALALPNKNAYKWKKEK